MCITFVISSRYSVLLGKPQVLAFIWMLRWHEPPTKTLMWAKNTPAYCSRMIFLISIQQGTQQRPPAQLPTLKTSQTPLLTSIRKMCMKKQGPPCKIHQPHSARNHRTSWQVLVTHWEPNKIRQVVLMLQLCSCKFEDAYLETDIRRTDEESNVHMPAKCANSLFHFCFPASFNSKYTSCSS